MPWPGIRFQDLRVDLGVVDQRAASVGEDGVVPGYVVGPQRRIAGACRVIPGRQGGGGHLERPAPGEIGEPEHATGEPTAAARDGGGGDRRQGDRGGGYHGLGLGVATEHHDRDHHDHNRCGSAHDGARGYGEPSPRRPARLLRRDCADRRCPARPLRPVPPPQQGRVPRVGVPAGEASRPGGVGWSGGACRPGHGRPLARARGRRDAVLDQGVTAHGVGVRELLRADRAPRGHCGQVGTSALSNPGISGIPGPRQELTIMLSSSLSSEDGARGTRSEPVDTEDD